MKKRNKTICILLGIAVICILLCVISVILYRKNKTVETITINQDSLIEERIVIDGLEGEYDLLFLTDTHMVVQSEEDEEDVAANAASRYPMFCDALGIPSTQHFPGWMAYANELEADAVLFGGDIIDYPSAPAVSYLKENVDTLEMPYLYTLGNHDWTYPWEYMTDTAKEQYIPLLKNVMQQNEAIQSLDMGEFLIVSVDNSSNQVNPDALAEYEAILAQGKPVIVLVHVPFLTQSVLSRAKEVWPSPVVIGGGNYGGIYPSEESEAFVQMTTAADSPVVAVLAGHVHFYDKDYIEGDKPVIQIVGNAGYLRSGMLIHISGEE